MSEASLCLPSEARLCLPSEARLCLPSEARLCLPSEARHHLSLPQELAGKPAGGRFAASIYIYILEYRSLRSRILALRWRCGVGRRTACMSDAAVLLTKKNQNDLISFKFSKLV